MKVRMPAVVWTVLGVAAVIGFLLYGTRVSEEFVLPQGYRGPFIALYGQEGGETGGDGNNPVFNVPSDGVVRIALPEPKTSTSTFFVSAGKRVDSDRLCTELASRSADSATHVCWLDYQVGGSEYPYHIVGVVTDVKSLPANYDRTIRFYDSVVFKGSGLAGKTWAENEREVRKIRERK